MNRFDTLTIAISFAVALCFSAGRLAAAETGSTVLVVQKMCCGKESKPAIAELTKIPGVASVTPDHKAYSLTVATKPGTQLSPAAVWDAAVRARLVMVRLTTPSGVFTSRPGR